VGHRDSIKQQNRPHSSMSDWGFNLPSASVSPVTDTRIRLQTAKNFWACHKCGGCRHVMQLMRQRTKNVRVNASSVACTLRFPVIPEVGQANGLPWIWVELGDFVPVPAVHYLAVRWATSRRPPPTPLTCAFAQPIIGRSFMGLDSDAQHR
jgi:hypothetical protein